MQGMGVLAAGWMGSVKQPRKKTQSHSHPSCCFFSLQKGCLLGTDLKTDTAWVPREGNEVIQNKHLCPLRADCIRCLEGRMSWTKGVNRPFPAGSVCSLWQTCCPMSWEWSMPRSLLGFSQPAFLSSKYWFCAGGANQCCWKRGCKCLAEQWWPFLAARLTHLPCFLQICAHGSGVRNTGFGLPD